jgi:hypothetical protein
MARIARLFLKFLLVLSISISCAHATIIDYATTQLGANRWRYDYTIHNDTLGIPLEEFTIYFREDLFANLSDESSLPGWDLLLIQPNTSIPAAGFIDGLALAAGIGAGDSLSGLSISFDYLGTGAPGSQLFSIVDPFTFVELDAGSTRSTAVPLPGSLSLFALGLVAVAYSKRRQRGAQ